MLLAVNNQSEKGSKVMVKQNLFILKSCSILLITFFLFSSCAKSAPTLPENTYRRNQEGDVCLSTDAKPYIENFKADYPDMDVTKVRWQKIPSGEETYIIEGIKGDQKAIVKYLMGSDMVLGRVERKLTDEEICDGVCIEKPLELGKILTKTELCEIAQNQLGNEVFEVNVCWKKDTPTAYVEVADEKLKVSGLTIDAVSGEILY